MSFSGVIGHQKIKSRFQYALAGDRLASTFLFTGLAGIGKRRFAKALAKTLLCQHPTSDPIDACNHCSACTQVDAETHPDFFYVCRKPDKNRLLIEQFVGEKEKRGRDGLCHDIALKSFAGGRKIAIIDDADFLNLESANALLKTLEEPPADSIIILIGTSEQKQLPTIRSRCQVIRFDPLTNEQVESILLRDKLLEDESMAAAIARGSGGSLEMALVICDQTTMEFRKIWFDQLAGGEPFSDQFGKTIAEFVDAASKDASIRRDRLRLVSEFAIRFYQSLLMPESDGQNDHDPDLSKAISIAKRTPLPDVNIADCLERCFAVQGQIQANANPANVIESWLIDLGRAARGDWVPVE